MGKISGLKKYSFYRNPQSDKYELYDGSESDKPKLIYVDVINNERYEWNENLKYWNRIVDTDYKDDTTLVIEVYQNRRIRDELSTEERYNEKIWFKNLNVETKFPYLLKDVKYSKALKIYKNNVDKIKACQNKTLFKVEIEADYDRHIITLTNFYVDIDILINADKSIEPDYFTSGCTFDLDKGNYDYTADNDSYNLKKQPPEVLSFFMEKFFEMRNQWAGRKVSANSCEEGLIYAAAATEFPYEPNLYFLKLTNYENDFLEGISRENPEGFNILCKNLDVTCFKTLRKLYLKNPNSLIAYSILKKAGFKDKNVMVNILNTVELDRIVRANETFICFMNEYLQKKPETSAAGFINKAHARYYFDTLDMFSEYRKHIAKPIVDDIIEDGLTEYNHDVLAKLSQIIENDHIIFNYNDTDLKYECEIGEYKFIIPRRTEDLIQLGIDMKNCVASYCKNVIEKKSLMVCAEKSGEKKICIEIRKNKVVQAFEKKNAMLSEESENVMWAWMDKYGLEKCYL